MSDIKKISVNAIGAENSGENCSASEPFALRILDSSMAPEFEINHIVIIDPSISPKDGDFVLFETSDSLIIRKIEITESMTLKALNPSFNDISIENTESILGVITQRSGKRRKFHKRYN